MMFCEPRKTPRFCHLRPATCGYDVIRALITAHHVCGIAIRTELATVTMFTNQ
mgnify:CR=1 FL=1|jgi:hypothetical protein